VQIIEEFHGVLCALHRVSIRVHRIRGSTIAGASDAYHAAAGDHARH
jgi:hypothetical protein